MRAWQNQSHVTWYCRYHVIMAPKYRRKSMFGVLRRDIGLILKELCRRFGIDLVEGHVMPDHIHMCLGIPPKYSVANKNRQAERKVRDHDSSAIRAKAGFCRDQFLGARVLRKHGWSRRGRDPELHSDAGGARKERGADEFGSLTLKRRVGSEPPFRGLPQSTRYAGSCAPTRVPYQHGVSPCRRKPQLRSRR